MSGTAAWAPADIAAVREHAPGTDPRDIRALLDSYRKRGLARPVAYARKAAEDGQLARDLADIGKNRKKAATARTVDELRAGPECPHGVPGGMSPHPDSGKPLCPLCRQDAAPAAGDSDGTPDTPAPDSPDDATPTAAPLETWTAADLMRQQFPPARWAVFDLVPEGVMFLAGAPKTGKSWLALDLAIAVATGGSALGKIATVKGDVLYLALEDTPRRLQNRLAKVLGGRQAPDALTLALNCPPLPHGGADLIRGWLASHPAARLVIIDVFARIRGPISSSGSAYAADYAAVTSVKKLADESGVAIILVHHMRKMASEDYLNELSGTLGLSGAADTIAVLKRTRGDHDATLSITGRDVEENEYAMKFHADSGTWELIGAASEHALPDTRRAILDYLRANDGHGPKQIAAGTGLDYELVKKTALRMASDGQLDRDPKRGRYFIPAAVPAVPAT